MHIDSFLGNEAIAIITNLKFADDAPGAIKFGNELIQAKIIQHVTKDHTFKNENLFYEYCMDLSKVPNLETIKYTSVRKNKAKSRKVEPSKSSKEEQDEESKYNSRLAEIDRVKT